MAVREILLLGNPLLYRTCEPVSEDELPDLRDAVHDLHDTLHDFRARHGAGRAIAAPQIGVMKRVVYMHLPKPAVVQDATGGNVRLDEPVVFFNPRLHDCSDELLELWDDCMSFPDLLVRVRRHRRCRINFRDPNWVEHEWLLEDDLSELLQHEVDHLDGILAVSRAVGPHAFALRSQRSLVV